MIQRIRRLGVGQMAKVLGALYFLLGIVAALIFWIAGSMIPATASGRDTTLFGTGFILAMPLLYAVMGVVFGALIAWFYNLVAEWTGGIELELEAASA
jgi:Ca2+/Na+ antiporter